jgi:hypothetical protein
VKIIVSYSLWLRGHKGKPTNSMWKRSLQFIKRYCQTLTTERPRNRKQHASETQFVHSQQWTSGTILLGLSSGSACWTG